MTASSRACTVCFFQPKQSSHAVKAVQLVLPVTGSLCFCIICCNPALLEGRWTVSFSAQSLLHQYENSQVYREGTRDYSGLTLKPDKAVLGCTCW